MILIADSGSTKTDWALLHEGSLVGKVKTQGINPIHQSKEQITEILRQELLQGDTFRGVTTSQGDAVEASSVSEIYFYGAGCTEAMSPIVSSALKGVFSSAKVIEVNSDLMAAARALCGRSEGIACILGTGANSCLYDGVHIVMNTPPLGYILGDEGSGAVLGKLFLNALFKGALPAAMRDEYLATYNLSYADVIDRVYRKPLANRFLASASPFILSHIEQCQELRHMVIESFRDFFCRNIVQYRKPDLPVNFIGSIAFAYRPYLELAAEQEHFGLGRVEKSPLEGLVEYHKG